MPIAIQVPDGNKVFLVGHAVGVQVYACNTTPSGYSWAFVAPRANLYDDQGKLLATHFAGPTWQAKDGSYVVGRVVDRVTDDNAYAPRPLPRTRPCTRGPGEGGKRIALRGAGESETVTAAP